METKSKRRQQVSLLCIDSPLLLKTVGTAVGAILHPRFTRLGQEKSLFLAQRLRDYVGVNAVVALLFVNDL